MEQNTAPTEPQSFDTLQLPPAILDNLRQLEYFTMTPIQAASLPLALAGVAETFLGLRAVFLGLAALVVAGGIFTWYISRTGSTPRT